MCDVCLRYSSLNHTVFVDSRRQIYAGFSPKRENIFRRNPFRRCMVTCIHGRTVLPLCSCMMVTYKQRTIEIFYEYVYDYIFLSEGKVRDRSTLRFPQQKLYKHMLRLRFFKKRIYHMPRLATSDIFRLI